MLQLYYAAIFLLLLPYEDCLILLCQILLPVFHISDISGAKPLATLNITTVSVWR